MTPTAAGRVAAFSLLTGTDRGTLMSTICFWRGDAAATIAIDADAG